MTKLLEIVQKLTDGEQREVLHFAEFLLTRRKPSLPGEIEFGGWAGSLSHVNKTAIELTQEANDLRVEWVDPME